jgi:hypothetical protein
MTRTSDVLLMLIPQGGWHLIGDDFDDVNWIDAEAKITRAEFDAGVIAYDSYLAKAEATKATEKAALLAKLGISELEAALLLG